MTNPYMKRAIELSASFKNATPDLTPFGAVIVLDGTIIGEGISSVVQNVDPTAHAEILAIREAATTTGDHILSGAVMYCSGYPCPFCLMGCYWAQIKTVVYGAELEDSEAVGFEDQYFYNQLRLDADQRDVSVTGIGGEGRAAAALILRQWKNAHQDLHGLS